MVIRVICSDVFTEGLLLGFLKNMKKNKFFFGFLGGFWGIFGGFGGFVRVTRFPFFM